MFAENFEKGITDENQAWKCEFCAIVLNTPYTEPIKMQANHHRVAITKRESKLINKNLNFVRTNKITVQGHRDLLSGALGDTRLPRIYISKKKIILL